MNEARNQAGQSLLVPARIALRAEKDRALVVIQPVNHKSALVEIQANFGADQSGRTGHENDLFARHHPITPRPEEM